MTKRQNKAPFLRPRESYCDLEKSIGYQCCFLWPARTQQLVPLRTNQMLQRRSRAPALRRNLLQPRRYRRQRGRLPTPAAKRPIPMLNRTRIQNGFWASSPTSSPRMISRKTRRLLLQEKNTFSRTTRRSISARTSETRFRQLSSRLVTGSLTMDKDGGPTPSDSGQRKRTRSRQLFSYLAFCHTC